MPETSAPTTPTGEMRNSQREPQPRHRRRLGRIGARIGERQHRERERAATIENGTNEAGLMKRIACCPVALPA